MFTNRAEAFIQVAAAVVPTNASTMQGAMVVQDRQFAVCADTGSDNRYLDLGQPADPELAYSQQLGLAQQLRSLGLPVVAFPGLAGASDSVFPNNAFAPYQGRLLIGAMHHRVRQQETARADVRQFFSVGLGFELVEVGGADEVAELTGTLVIDHARQVGYCGLSERTNLAGAQAMHEAFGLRATLYFELAKGEYHTNVILSILAGRAAVVHAPSAVGGQLIVALEQLYGMAVLRLSDDEKAQFAGNCIAATPGDLLLSSRAEANLRPASRAFFANNGFTLHPVDVSELERAGGSVRCMIAEIISRREADQ